VSPPPRPPGGGGLPPYGWNLGWQQPNPIGGNNQFIGQQNQGIPIPFNTVQRIPRRGERHAPQFDGMPQHLNRYFADVERVYQGYQYNDRHLIDAAIEYLDYETSALWETVSEQQRNISWREFKDGVQTLYPGSDGQRLYTIPDLERLVRDFADKGITTRGGLGEYYRQFTV